MARQLHSKNNNTLTINIVDDVTVRAWRHTGELLPTRTGEMWLLQYGYYTMGHKHVSDCLYLTAILSQTDFYHFLYRFTQE